jgi:hypothetical protein
MWDRSSANLLFLTPVHEEKIVFKKHRVQLLKRGGGDAQKVQQAVSQAQVTTWFGLQPPVLRVSTILLMLLGGTRWRSWLGHCATSRNVAGSIPNGHNLSGHTIALESTQYQEYLLGG